jgi:hypothetical protein
MFKDVRRIFLVLAMLSNDGQWLKCRGKLLYSLLEVDILNGPYYLFMLYVLILSKNISSSKNHFVINIYTIS